MGDNGYKISVIRDPQFDITQRVLEAKRKELKAQGMGNKENRALSLSPEQENYLWDANIMGDSTPTKLQRAMWYLLTIQLGMYCCPIITIANFAFFESDIFPLFI